MKNILIIIICLFASSPCNAPLAQSISECNEKGLELYTKGLYSQALPHAKKAFQMASQEYGEGGLEVAVYANNLGVLYRALKEYDKSLAVLQSAIRIDSVWLGTDNLDYAEVLYSLGNLYVEIGEFVKAESTLLRAVEIESDWLGNDDPALSFLLESLGILYQNSGDYRKAKEVLHRKMLIDSMHTGTDRPEFAYQLLELASISAHANFYQEAERYCLEAHDIFKRIAIDGHPGLFESYFDLVGVWIESSQLDSIGGKIKLAHAIFRKWLSEQAGSISDKQLQKIWANYSPQFSMIHSSVYHTKALQNDLPGIGYDAILFEKEGMLRLGYRSQDVPFDERLETKRLLDSIRCIERKIMEIDLGRNVVGIQSARKFLEYQTNELQEMLQKQRSGMKNMTTEDPIRWEQIRDALDDSSAAIEYVFFPEFLGGDSGIFRFGAYVLRAWDTLPHFIPLCSWMELLANNPADSTGFSRIDYVNQIPAFRGVAPLSRERHHSKNLFQLIWEPLDSLFDGIRTIYYSPAGALHHLAFDAISTDGGSLLHDHYRLVRLGTTYKVISGGKELYSTDLSRAMIFGDVNYNFDSQFEIELRNDSIIPDVERPAWPILPGTKIECRKIVEILAQCNIDITYQSAISANEQNFYDLTGGLWETEDKASPGLIHLATHGFANQPIIDNAESTISNSRSSYFLRSDAPLLRTGLVLSGGNKAWREGNYMDGLLDGVLTGAEIALMDLYNTRLVVLSACQSGLGDVWGHEGVFGLQRAFKLAGVELVIASLWRVPDKETAEFMELFYGDFVAGMEVREAFRGAQEEMRERYRDEPYKWAAFVLME